MNVSYILTGSNLGNRPEYLLNAKKAIVRSVGDVVKESSVYETAAWGIEDQPSFLNQAFEVHTPFSARELLHGLLKIEGDLGRKRTLKYGPRFIDIDILFFNIEVIEEKGLTIPHAQLHKRRFALQCLYDIAPNFVHPVFCKTVKQLLAECVDPLPVKKL
ncbi:MAG: 2-amino-4-hydroxy-6-hydroxymethyldihydropteridine diphosphokinase [Chitinophagaceae bacterium]